MTADNLKPLYDREYRFRDALYGAIWRADPDSGRASFYPTPTTLLAIERACHEYREARRIREAAEGQTP
jgi:hypothetical protein